MPSINKKCHQKLSYGLWQADYYVDFSFRYASFTLSLCYVSDSLCSLIVSLHYSNLFYFISVRQFVMWVCSFVMPMLYFVMLFFNVAMWTNPSIISVTATPVG